MVNFTVCKLYVCKPDVIKTGTGASNKVYVQDIKSLKIYTQNNFRDFCDYFKSLLYVSIYKIKKLKKGNGKVMLTFTWECKGTGKCQKTFKGE